MKWKTKKSNRPRPTIETPPESPVVPETDDFEQLKATVKKYNLDLIKETDEYDGTVRLRVKTKADGYSFGKHVAFGGWTTEDRLDREYGPLNVKLIKWARENGLTKKSERIVL